MIKRGFLVVSLVLSCCACAPKNIVDEPMIEMLKGQSFHLNSVRVPCDMGCIPALYGSSSQIKLLQAISADEVAKLLGNHYGITVAPENALNVKSKIIHFTGLLSESVGRCFYLQDDSVKSENLIDIKIKALATCGPFTGNMVQLLYDLEFSSGGKSVLRKYGEIGNVENKGVLFIGPQDFVDNVEGEVKKLPLIIRKDMTTGK